MSGQFTGGNQRHARVLQGDQGRDGTLFSARRLHHSDIRYDVRHPFWSITIASGLTSRNRDRYRASMTIPCCLPSFSRTQFIREQSTDNSPSFSRSWAEPVLEVVSPRSESNSWTTPRDPLSETSRAPSRLTTSWLCWNPNERLGEWRFWLHLARPG